MGLRKIAQDEGGITRRRTFAVALLVVVALVVAAYVLDETAPVKQVKDLKLLSLSISAD